MDSIITPPGAPSFPLPDEPDAPVEGLIPLDLPTGKGDVSISQVKVKYFSVSPQLYHVDVEFFLYNHTSVPITGTVTLTVPLQPDSSIVENVRVPKQNVSKSVTIEPDRPALVKLSMNVYVPNPPRDALVMLMFAPNNPLPNDYEVLYTKKITFDAQTTPTVLFDLPAHTEDTKEETSGVTNWKKVVGALIAAGIGLYILRRVA